MGAIAENGSSNPDQLLRRILLPHERTNLVQVVQQELKAHYPSLYLGHAHETNYAVLVHWNSRRFQSLPPCNKCAGSHRFPITTNYVRRWAWTNERNWNNIQRWKKANVRKPFTWLTSDALCLFVLNDFLRFLSLTFEWEIRVCTWLLWTCLNSPPC